jgi:hypothetical protein
VDKTNKPTKGEKKADDIKPNKKPQFLDLDIIPQIKHRAKYINKNILYIFPAASSASIWEKFYSK